MKRKVQLVLLCEDQQQEAFLRRFLQGTGWSNRMFRVVMGRPGAGGHAFVTSRFPIELQAYRTRRVDCALVVMIDGDNLGLVGRNATLDRACDNVRVPRRRGDDRVVVAVPTWNIETWLAYLDGETIDEGRDDYRRLPTPGQCGPLVKNLIAMRKKGALRGPSPASLEAACVEYRTRLLQRT
ncbi:MAG: hypothetical protein ACR2M4_02830 [Actinomycetota bacterium]